MTAKVVRMLMCLALLAVLAPLPAYAGGVSQGISRTNTASGKCQDDSANERQAQVEEDTQDSALARPGDERPSTSLRIEFMGVVMELELPHL